MIQISNQTQSQQYKKGTKAFKGIQNLYRTLCVLCLFAFVVSGCATMPPEAKLDEAPLSSNTIDKKVWLAKVEIVDPSLDNKTFKQYTASIDQAPTVYDKSATENTLTVNILKYLQEGRYFKEANFLSGNVGENDLVLRFKFDRYQLRRVVHPLYFPGALLTATLYIWVGGPIATEKINFSGKLIVEDFRGSQIAEVSSEVNNKRSVSLYSKNAAGVNAPRVAAEARTTLINELLNKASVAILKKGSK